MCSCRNFKNVWWGSFEGLMCVCVYVWLRPFGHPAVQEIKHKKDKCVGLCVCLCVWDTRRPSVQYTPYQ